MSTSIKKIGVLTSGGDAPGMNAALRAVVRTAAYHKIECVGIYQGYQGLIDNKVKVMNARSVNNIINKGGTVLKSARCLEFRTIEGRQTAFETIQKHGIKALVVIGGDGSFTGAMIFQSEFNIPVIGIPGTIDNDIFGTSHTIGYDTALNTVMNTGIGAGAEEVLIPEEDMGLDRLLDSLKRSEKSGKSSSIVVVAEGDKTGKNVFEIAEYVEKNMPYYDVRVSVLGHMQRGGSPSCFDRVLASRMGVYAVEALLEGKSNMMVGMKSEEIIFSPLEKAIKGKSEINKDLIRVSDILTI